MLPAALAALLPLAVSAAVAPIRAYRPPLRPAAALAAAPAASVAPAASAVSAAPALFSVSIAPGAKLGEAALTALPLKAEPAAAPASVSPAEAAAVQGGALFDGRSAFVLFGAANFGREFLLSEPARVASELGVKLVVVDEESRRPAPGRLPPGASFVAAPIGGHDEASMRETVARVTRHVRENGLRVVGAPYSFFNPFVGVAAMTRDALRADGHEFLGDAHAAVAAANDKAGFRALIARRAPELAVPSLKVATRDAALAAFRALSAAHPGRKFVLKPAAGAGKIGVLTDLASESQTAAAFDQVTASLAKFSRDNPALAKLLSIDESPPMLIELQLEGPEVDVEAVLGKTDGAAMVIGNPRAERPYQQEKGFTLPSQLPRAAHEALIRATLEGLDAVGLRYGNHHVELIYDKQLGPRIVEFNTRMGGGELFLMTRLLFGGWSLIEQGMRAMLGLPVLPPSTQSRPVFFSRVVLPAESGTVVSIKGVEALERAPGVMSVVMLKRAGDSIVAAKDGFADDEYAYVFAGGADFKTVAANVLRALAGLEITVKTKDGRYATQNGAWSHRLEDEDVALPK